MNKFIKLINKILEKVSFRKIIFFRNCINKKNAFIYYKTESFVWRLFNKENHTNNAEIILMVKLLLELGYNVTLLDRSASKYHIRKIKQKFYDILIINNSGNSCPHNEFIQNFFKFKNIIAYVVGPEPNLANSLTYERHKEYKKRIKPKEIIYRRIVKGSKKELSKRFTNVCSILFIGNKFSEESYKMHEKPLFRIYPSISKSLRFDSSDLIHKNKNHFIYFGGAGCIVKGLDLVIDSTLEILKHEEIFLDICAPENESDFWKEYKPKIQDNRYINYHGFVDINSKKFLDLTRKSSFNIFPGSAEGSATSVLTCMRRAVIPVVTYETGIDIKDFGILLKSKKLDVIVKTMRDCTIMDHKQFHQRLINTYKDSWNYSPETYINSIRKGILYSDNNYLNLI